MITLKINIVTTQDYYSQTLIVSCMIKDDVLIFGRW